MRLAVIRVEKESGGSHTVTLSAGDALDALTPKAAGTIARTPELVATAEVLRAPDVEACTTAGEQLYAALGGITDAWAQERAGGELRTFLDLHGLEHLPWELMLDGSASLAAKPALPIVRWRDPRAAAAPPPLGWPLRVLLVVGSEAEDEAVLAEQEVAAISRVLHEHRGQLDLHLLERPSLTEFAAECESVKPHILHFTGHGTMDAKRPVLLVHDRTAQVTNMVDAAWLDNVLGGAWKPRLVYLAACRSGEVLAENAAWGLEQTLRGAGVRAVIAMRSNVRGPAAVLLSTGFYAALARTGQVDVALAEARRTVLKPGAAYRREAGAASLTIACAPEHVFPVKPIEETRLESVRKVTEYSWLGRFVNHATERRRLGASDHGLFVISGEHEAGKSWLTYWMLERAQLWDWAVYFADMRGTRALDLLETLRALHWGEPDVDCLLRGPKPLPEALKRFGHVLNHINVLQSGNDLPALPDGSPVVDNRNLLSWQQPEDKAAKKVMGELRSALANGATVERPVLIAIDHFNMVVPHRDNYLIPHLVDPIARGKLPHVRMVLTMSDTMRQSCGLDHLGTIFDDIKLQKAPPTKYRDYGLEFLHRIGKNSDEELTRVRDVLAKRTKPFLLKALEALEEVLG